MQIKEPGGLLFHHDRQRKESFPLLAAQPAPHRNQQPADETGQFWA